MGSSSCPCANLTVLEMSQLCWQLLHLKLSTEDRKFWRCSFVFYEPECFQLFWNFWKGDHVILIWLAKLGGFRLEVPFKFQSRENVVCFVSNWQWIASLSGTFPLSLKRKFHFLIFSADQDKMRGSDNIQER